MQLAAADLSIDPAQTDAAPTQDLPTQADKLTDSSARLWKPSFSSKTASSSESLLSVPSPKPATRSSALVTARKPSRKLPPNSPTSSSSTCSCPSSAVPKSCKNSKPTQPPPTSLSSFSPASRGKTKTNSSRKALPLSSKKASFSKTQASC